MNILHVNSYYIAVPLYKNQGFAQQFPEGLVGYHTVADDVGNIYKNINRKIRANN